MTYEQYLFAKLLALYDLNFAEEPYDHQFEYALMMYTEFEQSSYNEENKNLYQCIVSYLKDKYRF